MRLDHGDREALAAQLHEQRPDWPHNTIAARLRQIAPRAETLHELRLVCHAITDAPGSTIADLADLWAVHARVYRERHAAIDEAVESKPTDAVAQRRRILAIIGKERAGDERLAELLRQRADRLAGRAAPLELVDDEAVHDGWSVAVSISLDERMSRDRWLVLDGFDRAAAINRWARIAPLTAARDESGLSLLLDVKADQAAADEQRAAKRASDEVHRRTWVPRSQRRGRR